MNKKSLFTDPVKVHSGYKTGTLEGKPDDGVYAYRGIPYAAPPVAKPRWRPPQSAKQRAGILGFRSPSPQQLQPLGPKLNTPEDKDCLYLNVYSAAQSVGQNLPAMVWLRGGGYWAGGGNEEMYNINLSQAGVVLATVNMRLGALG